METTIVFWGNIGIMENKMEATIMGLYGVVIKIMVLYWGTLNIRGPYYNRDPKTHHNFDNHPYVGSSSR